MTVNQPVFLNNAKAVQLDEARILEIERSNLKLFERMQEIELKPPQNFQKNAAPRHIVVGRIDHKRR